MKHPANSQKGRCAITKFRAPSGSEIYNIMGMIVALAIISPKVKGKLSHLS